MTKEVLAPVASIAHSFVIGALHSLVYLALTLGFGAWLWGGL